MAEKHYEMLWDCQYCGTKKLLGKTHRYCPNCGGPQDTNSRYYPSDDEKIAVEDHVFVGVDVTCPACSQLNSGGAEFCQQCGSPLSEGAKAKTLESQSRAQGARFDSSGSRDIVKEKFEAEQAPPASSGFDKRWLIAGAVVILLIGAVIWYFTRTETASVLVTGHEWERVISVQEYKNFTEASWWDVRPSGDGVQMGGCVQQQRSTRQVPDGETCTTVRTDRGDGTFSEREVCTPKYRSEPVYDRMCTWSGKRWEASRQVLTSGGLAQTPAWGEPNLKCANQSTLGCERESGRTESYNLLLKGAFDNTEYQYTCPLDQATWAETRIETAFTLEVNAVNKQNANCDTLKRVQ